LEKDYFFCVRIGGFCTSSTSSTSSIRYPHCGDRISPDLGIESCPIAGIESCPVAGIESCPIAGIES
jgi:hypothetical protein